MAWYLRNAFRLGPVRLNISRRGIGASASVPGKYRHDFRRTAMRNIEGAGVPRSVAMKITGHLTENVYRRCAIVSDADLREATARLMGTFAGTVGHRGS